MQKKLIALAIAGAFAAPAFAATSNVEISGQVNVAVDFIDADRSGDQTEDRVMKVSSNASRLGFKGSEDLGGGLSAIWMMEVGFNADSTAGDTFTERNAYAGLSSKSFGTIKIGRHDTPYKSYANKMDAFGDTLGDWNAIVGSFSQMPSATRSSSTTSTGAGTASYTWSRVGGNAFDLRESNTITYDTPDFSGFSASIQYGARDESSNSIATGEWAGITTINTDPSLWSVAAKYENGPLFLVAAYEKHNDTLVDINGPANGSTTQIDATAWKVGASYTMAGLTAGLLYEKIKLDTEDVDGGNAFGKIDHNTWYGSLAYKMGAATLKGAYARASESCSNCNDGARQWTVGVDYAMSKRTKVYALYTDLKSDVDGLWTLGGNGTSGGELSGNVGGGNGNVNESGNDPSGFSIGIKHSF